MRNSSGIPQRSGLAGPIVAILFTLLMLFVLYVVPTLLVCGIIWHFVAKFW